MKNIKDLVSAKEHKAHAMNKQKWRFNKEWYTLKRLEPTKSRDFCQVKQWKVR